MKKIITLAELELLEFLEEDCNEFIRIIRIIRNGRTINNSFCFHNDLPENIGNLRADLIKLCQGELCTPGAIEMATIKRLDVISRFIYEHDGKLKIK